MKRIKLVLFVVLGLLLVNQTAFANTKGTRDEAKALTEKAVALIKAGSPEKAYAQFQNKDGGFIDRDLYVFVLDNKGTFLAHGAKPVLVGKGSLAMKDVTGFAFIEAFLAVKDNAWVDYKWPDPADGNKVKDKSTYVVRVGDTVLGVGYYKE